MRRLVCDEGSLDGYSLPQSSYLGQLSQIEKKVAKRNEAHNATNERDEHCY